MRLNGYFTNSCLQISHVNMSSAFGLLASNPKNSASGTALMQAVCFVVILKCSGFRSCGKMNKLYLKSHVKLCLNQVCQRG